MSCLVLNVIQCWYSVLYQAGTVLKASMLDSAYYVKRFVEFADLDLKDASKKKKK